MKIGGHCTLEEIHSADLEKFAAEIEIRAPFVRRRMNEIASAILERSSGVMSGLRLRPERRAIAEMIKDGILRRADLVLSHLESRV